MWALPAACRELGEGNTPRSGVSDARVHQKAEGLDERTSRRPTSSRCVRSSPERDAREHRTRTIPA
jgi:hypothetical protein